MSFFITKSVDEYGTTLYNPTMAGYTALVIIMLGLVILGCYFFGAKQKFTTIHLAFSAMAIALATVTSMIKLFHLPMGGSITLFSMLFITLIGYWFGLGAGLTTAIAYGVLQLILDPYILSLPQMLVDYIFAFGALGLSGIFSNAKYGLYKGYIAGVIGRYFFATLSGVIFFGAYASGIFEGQPLLYSLAYNGIYLAAEAALTLIVLSVPQVRNALAMVKETATKQMSR